MFNVASVQARLIYFIVISLVYRYNVMSFHHKRKKVRSSNGCVRVFQAFSRNF